MTPQNSATRSGRFYAGALLLFAAAVFLIYANALHAPFIFDDTNNIVENRHIRITRITIEQVGGLLKNLSSRPVADVTFAFNYYLGQYNPFGYHLVNILIHLAAGFLLFIFIKQTLGLSLNRGSAESAGFLIPFFAALVWLVHPLNTQSVTYVIQRMNALAALFYLFSLICYIRGRIIQRSSAAAGGSRKPLWAGPWLWFLASVGSGLLALASKQNAAFLPAFIFLYEWFFFQGLNRDWIRKKLPWILGIILVMATVAALLIRAAPQVLYFYKVQDFTLCQRLLTEARVVIFYLSLIFFPHHQRLNLAHDYPLSQSLIHPWTSLLCLAVIIGLIGFAVFAAKKDRLISFSLLWFFGNLAIESSFVGLALIFEHRTYLPSMLVCFLVVFLFFEHAKHHRIAAVLLCAILLVFSVWTHQRNQVWGERLGMWQDCIAKSPDRAWPYLSYGVDLAENPDKIPEAVSYIQKAIEKRPDFPEALFAMGVARTNQNRPAEAMAYYRKALSLDSNFKKAHIELGLALVSSGDLSGAAEHFSKAVMLDPEDARAQGSLANVLCELGRPAEAIPHYLAALTMEPENALVYNNLANAYVRLGELKKAVQFYARALQIDPENLSAKQNLAAVLRLQKGSP
jgi:protein O-mannosyl-transferase